MKTIGTTAGSGISFARKTDDWNVFSMPICRRTPSQSDAARAMRMGRRPELAAARWFCVGLTTPLRPLTSWSSSAPSSKGTLPEPLGLYPCDPLPRLFNRWFRYSRNRAERAGIAVSESAGIAAKKTGFVHNVLSDLLRSAI